MLFGLFAIVALGSAQAGNAQSSGPPAAPQSNQLVQPVTPDDQVRSLFLSGSKAFDVVDNGRSYRIFVDVPAEPAPPGGFPLLVVLDGNVNFELSRQLASGRARWKEIPPLIVVGVGYPTTSYAEMLSRRVYDLTPTVETDPRVVANRAPGTTSGGAAKFRAFLTERLPGIIGALAPIDARCTTLYGHSLGGLFVVDTLLRSPGAYRQYFASSPSLWDDNFAVLKQKTGFRERLMANPLPIRVELSVGGAERSFPERQLRALPNLKNLPDVRMVDAMVELGQWLGGINGPRLHSAYRVVEGETHLSVMPGTMSRAVTMAAECN
jgi:predicted alpha/beta superfamily hydrolase